MHLIRICPAPGAASEGMTLAVEGHIPAHSRNDSTGRRRRTTSRLTQQQIRRINEYIESHLGDVIQTHHLSGVARLSRSHFCRIFKLTVGSTPAQYLLQLRLHRAKALLQESSSSLCEIANICGFVDQSHLTKMFRTRLGTTPARWRHQSLSGLVVVRDLSVDGGTTRLARARWTAHSRERKSTNALTEGRRPRREGKTA